MDIALILQYRFPGSVWVLSGDSYDGLEWLSDSPKPTEKELEALWPAVGYEHEYAMVEQARASAYRQTSDPIFFQYQRGDATEAEWLAAVDAVKDANPYPPTV
jgi:hypothetical protein